MQGIIRIRVRIDNPQAMRTVDATNPDKLSAVVGRAIMMQAPLADPLVDLPILRRRRPGRAPDLMHKQLLSTERFTVEQRVHPGPGDEPIVTLRGRFVAGEFKDGKTIAVLGTCFAGSGFSIEMTDR